MELLLLKQVHQKKKKKKKNQKTKNKEKRDLCHYWYFLNFSFKFQPNVSNRCHDLLKMSINLSDVF